MFPEHRGIQPVETGTWRGRFPEWSSTWSDKNVQKDDSNYNPWDQLRPPQVVQIFVVLLPSFLRNIFIYTKSLQMKVYQFFQKKLFKRTKALLLKFWNIRAAPTWPLSVWYNRRIWSAYFRHRHFFFVRASLIQCKKSYADTIETNMLWKTKILHFDV